MKKSLSQYTSAPIIKRDFGTQAFQDDVKGKITVLPELQTLIPPLQTEEYQQLEANLLREGCREPLLIWNTTADKTGSGSPATEVYVLIDGHNRYGICQRHQLDFRILFRQFETLEDARQFMIDNQLGRRNLTPEQTSYLRGLKYLSLKKDAHRPGKVAKSESELSAEDAGRKKAAKTEEILAEQYNVSPRTIRLDANFAKGVDKLDEPLREEVLSRKVKINKGNLIALGEMVTPAIPVTSVEEIQALVTPQSPSSGKKPPVSRQKPATPPEHSIQKRLTEVSKAAESLSFPSSDLRERCLNLISSVENVLKELDNLREQ